MSDGDGSDTVKGLIGRCGEDRCWLGVSGAAGEDWPVPGASKTYPRKTFFAASVELQQDPNLLLDTITLILAPPTGGKRCEH